MNIPDKAYEAAREALVKRGLLAVGDAAEIALEAAAPFIAAQALRDFASQVVQDDPDDDRWRWETSDVADAARAYARELDPL